MPQLEAAFVRSIHFAAARGTCPKLCLCYADASKRGVLTCLVSLLSLSTSTSAANSTASLTRKPESASNSVVSVRNSRQPQSLAAREYLFCDSLDTDLQPCTDLSTWQIVDVGLRESAICAIADTDLQCSALIAGFHPSLGSCTTGSAPDPVLDSPTFSCPPLSCSVASACSYDACVLMLGVE